MKHKTKLKGLVLLVLLFGMFLVGSVNAADWVETFNGPGLPGDWTSAAIPGFFDSDSWTVLGGNLRNYADESASSIIYYDNAETTSWTDYSVVVPVFDGGNLSEGGAAGIVFRVQNADNFYYAVIDFSGYVKLGKRVGSVLSEIASTGNPHSAPDKIRVIAVGNRIRVYVDDTLEIDETDSDLSYGSVGAYARVDYIDEAIWDEFQVTFFDWIEPFDGPGLPGDWTSADISGSLPWSINSGDLESTNHNANDKGVFYYDDGMSWTNYSVTVPVVDVPAWYDEGVYGTGIVFRYQDINNFYAFEFGWNYGDHEWRKLFKVIDGNEILIEELNGSPFPPLKITVSLDGANIKVYINDTEIIDKSDSDLSSGTIGAYVDAQEMNEPTRITWDEFQVTFVGPIFIDIGFRAYDGTETVPIAVEPLGTLTSPLRIYKNGNTYGVVLVDTSDPNASKIRIPTSGGTKALRKF